jgi:O-antigen/teichoic acid export membrane protein
MFSAMRGIILFTLLIPVSFLLFHSASDSRLGGYFLLVGGATLVGTLTGPFREAFYGFFRQGRITKVDVMTSVLLLLSMIFLFFSRDVLTYGWLQLFSAVVGVILWYFTAVKHLHFRFISGVKLKFSIDALRGFSFWNHLSGWVVKLVYQIDIVILGFFAALSGVGSYSVALTLANVFFLFPQMVQKVLSLSFSQLPDERVPTLFGVGVRYNTALSLIQWIGFVLLGWVLMLIVQPENPDHVLTYGVYIAAGVAIINVARPWIALSLSRIYPRKIFFELYLIPSLAAVPIYIYAASVGGVLGVAQANVITFSILSGWIILYTTWKVPIRPDVWRLAPFEKDVLRRVARIAGVRPHH